MRPGATALAMMLSALVLSTAAGLATTCTTTAAQAQATSEARQIATQIHEREQYAEGLRIRQEDGTFGTFPPGASGEAEGARRFDRSAGTGGVEERRASDQRRGTPPSTLPSFNLPHVNGELLAILLQVLAALALLAIVIAVAMAVIRRDASSAPAPKAAPRPITAQAPAPETLPWDVGDADALFAEGRLAEAIVALLVESLRASGWTPERERGRTAREVLWGLDASDPRRPPLSLILRGAERVRFAGELPTDALFHELRSHREDLLASLLPSESR